MQLVWQRSGEVKVKSKVGIANGRNGGIIIENDIGNLMTCDVLARNLIRLNKVVPYSVLVAALLNRPRRLPRTRLLRTPYYESAVASHLIPKRMGCQKRRCEVCWSAGSP